MKFAVYWRSLLTGFAGDGRDHAQMIRELYAAIRDGRVEDMLALVADDVTCHPLVRPGLSTYYGHGGMIELASDMRTAHGNYQIEIDKVIEEDGSKVIVQARIISEAGRGRAPLSITGVYGFRDGLIISIENSSGVAEY